ncbi:polyunsaturated fatty acid 5-lipoxygenase-like [Mercenaria mercenaria]|uniref:polyunsaturated fatty acid 5-lipoxygenase-like n=1 Tax=Mercenaria mercenaria TaxID=6596 RepID=UPI00234F1C3A|nr:polyunsaturated fatty acid 5-lipoxygenase-like [Mercenaria mercenaria]
MDNLSGDVEDAMGGRTGKHTLNQSSSNSQPMYTYKISVKTGDRPKAGTDANVYVVLHSNGQKSPETKLDVLFRNDFERGQVDTFQISKVPFATIDCVELWKDNFGIYSEWNIDTITIDNINTGEQTVFPIFRWISSNYRYNFIPLDTSLPQYDERKEQRQKELEEKRALYEIAPPAPGMPSRIKSIPPDEEFSFDYLWDLNKKKLLLLATSKIKTITTGAWKSIDDVNTIYTKKVFTPPTDTERWKDDVKFGNQRIAGVNTTTIRLCTEIPDKFGVTAEMVEPFLEGKTLENALKDRKIFIIDYDVLEDCPTKEGHTVCSPIALFYKRDDRKLVPVAIQLFQHKAEDNPVFLPSDPQYTWIWAKMWFNNADAQYHQAVTHLGYTHLIMEGFVVVTHRNMSQSHPLFKLLAPHFLYLIAINTRAVNKLSSKDGILDQTFSVEARGMFELIRRRRPRWRFDVDGIIPEDFKARGVDDPNDLPRHHARDDSIMIYDAIKKYVQKYVDLYYKTNDVLLADEEVQNWREELVRSENDNGLGMIGVPGEDGKFTKKEQLVIVLTSVISICSVGHAMANFAQYDEYSHPLNYPSLLRGTPPKDKSPRTEADIVASLPDKEQHFQIMITGKILSERGTKPLGDFEVNYVFDPEAVKIVNEFRADLARIRQLIVEKNKTRDLPYPYLDPAEVPNSISI